MQGLLAILCFAAGVVVGWLVLRKGKSALEASFRKQEEEKIGLQERVSFLMAREAELSARMESEQHLAKDKQMFLEKQVSEQSRELHELREKATSLSVRAAELEAR